MPFKSLQSSRLSLLCWHLICLGSDGGFKQLVSYAQARVAHGDGGNLVSARRADIALERMNDTKSAKLSRGRLQP